MAWIVARGGMSGYTTGSSSSSRCALIAAASRSRASPDFFSSSVSWRATSRCLLTIRYSAPGTLLTHCAVSPASKIDRTIGTAAKRGRGSSVSRSGSTSRASMSV